MAELGASAQPYAHTSLTQPSLKAYNLKGMNHEQLMKLACGFPGEIDPLVSTLAGVLELSDKTERLNPIHADTMGGVTPESSYFKAWKAVVKPARTSVLVQNSQKQGPKPIATSGLSARAMSQLALPPEAVRFRTALMAFLDRHVELTVHVGRAATVLDLRRLFYEVMSEGGSVAATNSDSWPDIAAELVHDSKLVNQLQQVYNFYLKPLEESMPWGTRAGRIVEYMESKVKERADVASSGRTAQRLCDSTRKLLRQAYWKETAALDVAQPGPAEATSQPGEKNASSAETRAGASVRDALATDANPARPPAIDHESFAEPSGEEVSLGEGKAPKLALLLLRQLAANPMMQVSHLALVPGVRSRDAQQQLEEEDAKLAQQHLKQKRGWEEEEEEAHKHSETPLRGTKRSRARHHHHRADEPGDEGGEEGTMSLAKLARQPLLPASGVMDTNASGELETSAMDSQPTDAAPQAMSQAQATEDEAPSVAAASHALLLSALALRSGPPGCGLRKPPLLRKTKAVLAPEPALLEAVDVEEVKEESKEEDSPKSPAGNTEGRKKSAWTVTPKCGNCKTCLNPRLKKACVTNRERVALGLEPVLYQESLLKLKNGPG